MKNVFIEIWKLIREIFFFIIGIPIFILLFIIGIFYTFIKHIVKFDYSLFKQVRPLIRSVNLAFDGIANAGAGELLNDVFKVKGVIKFGKWYDTISAVTGLLTIYSKEISLRKFLDKVLGNEHCIKAITEQQHFYFKNLTENENNSSNP